jgi:hypothetical protein
MRHLRLLALALLGASSGTAVGQTKLPLDTGYDHAGLAHYPAPAMFSGPSTTADDYWIKVASYEPPAPSAAVAPAWVLDISTAGWPSMVGNSRWIGPSPTHASATGTKPSDPAYSLFRKCFCLPNGFRDPKLNFQLHADDRVRVWLNDVTSTLAGPADGLTAAGLSGATANAGDFREGLNCLYVLVEDYYGMNMGFNLRGTVEAWGLIPVAGRGVGVSFEPHTCGASSPAADASDRAALAAVRDIAMRRGAERLAAGASGRSGAVHSSRGR